MPAAIVQRNEDKVDRRYMPSLFAGGEEARIDSAHAECEQIVAQVRGKLEPADHLKLYECAFYATGPILEIGRLHGRSTTVLALGAEAAGHSHRITSIDVEERYTGWARRNLREHGIPDARVELLVGDSVSSVERLDPGFDVVFVDGDHTYEGVHRDLVAISRVVSSDGLVLFHDYYHPANGNGSYGVKRAVDELADRYELQFRGRYGGIALYECTRSAPGGF